MNITSRLFPAASLVVVLVALAQAQAPLPGPPGRGGQGQLPGGRGGRFGGPPRDNAKRRRAPQESAGASSLQIRARRFAGRKSTSTRAMPNSTGVSRPTAKGATSSPHFPPDVTASL